VRAERGDAGDSRGEHGRALPCEPTAEHDAAVVIGRVTSDRSYLLSQGSGGGTGAVALAAWLKFRRAVEAVDQRFGRQLLLKNIQTATYRVVIVEAIICQNIEKNDE
jgi:hypothetical protein